MRRAATIAVCLLLFGCAAQRLKTEYDSYLGRSVAELAPRLGPPDRQFDTGGGNRAFQWTESSEAPGAIVPIGGALIVSRPHDQECLASVVASPTSPKPSSLGDWIIRRWQYNGTGCH